MEGHSGRCRAVHGVLVTGLPDELVVAPSGDPSWPHIRFRRDPRPLADPPDGDLLDESHAVIDNEDGTWGVIEPGTATLRGRPAAAEGGLHPFLANMGAVLSYMHGREALHAAGFVTGGGAWAVVGESHSGKSSIAAALRSLEVGILGDDVLVTDGASAFAAPRFLNVRAEVATSLPDLLKGAEVIGRPPGWVRIRTDTVDAAYPLSGIVFLRAGDGWALQRLSPAESLPRLFAHRMVRRSPRNPAVLLELVRLPAFELSRPDELGRIYEGAELLAGLDAGRIASHAD